MKISASILATTLIDLKQILQAMDPDIIDFIHLDIMDGHFVPQLSFGEGCAKEISQATKIPLDVHLMVSNPEKEIPKYFPLKPRFITFHLEATHAPVRLSQSIRENGIGAGLAISPGTSVDLVEPLLDEIDLILLMSVEPGYYGQQFLKSSYKRASQLKKLIDEKNILLEIDGGISIDNIGRLSRIGVDISVTGSNCFKTTDVNKNVNALKLACSKAASISLSRIV